MALHALDAGTLIYLFPAPPPPFSQDQHWEYGDQLQGDERPAPTATTQHFYQGASPPLSKAWSTELDPLPQGPGGMGGGEPALLGIYGSPTKLTPPVWAEHRLSQQTPHSPQQQPSVTALFAIFSLPIWPNASPHAELLPLSDGSSSTRWYTTGSDPPRFRLSTAFLLAGGSISTPRCIPPPSHTFPHRRLRPPLPPHRRRRWRSRPSHLPAAAETPRTAGAAGRCSSCTRGSCSGALGSRGCWRPARLPAAHQAGRECGSTSRWCDSAVVRRWSMAGLTRPTRLSPGCCQWRRDWAPLWILSC
jgi:hypothetical protein